jgi:hypothetical protein
LGNKSNPSKYDCYSRAEPDEPVFVLLGRDPVASLLVAEWARLRDKLRNTEEEAIAEARECAFAMQQWALKMGKERQVNQAIGVARSFSVTTEELRDLCHRAADVIAEQVSINVADGGLRGRQELDDLVKELRGT